MPFLLPAAGAALGIGAGTGLPTALGLSTLGNFIAGEASNRAARSAQNANLAAARETNALNKQFFDESRGSTGSAVLPIYLSGFERSLGNNAADLALLGLSPENRAGFESDIAALRPGVEGSTTAVNDLFTGGNLATRLSALAPVQAARTKAAKTRLASIDQSLEETIGRLDAQMAQRGFSGGSSFDNRQLFNATLGARQSGAQAVSEADLLNAQDEAGLRDADALLRLQLAGLPFEQASRLTSLRSLPTTAAASEASAALQPLNFFRLGANAFQASPLPQVEPTLGTVGNIGAALSGVGSSLGDYFALQQLGRLFAPSAATPNFTPAPAPQLTLPNGFGIPQIPIP